MNMIDLTAFRCVCNIVVINYFTVSEIILGFQFGHLSEYILKFLQVIRTKKKKKR